MGSAGSDTEVNRRGFEAACAKDDVATALAHAKGLGRLNLEQAARLLATLGKTGHPLFDRAAVRWVQRYLADGADIELRDLAVVIDTILELDVDPSAVTSL